MRSVALMWVKCVGIDEKGRVRLSRTAAIAERNGEDDEISEKVAAAKEKGLEPAAILKLNEKFRDAYEKNIDATRYQATVAGKEIVVTPSQQLAGEVAQIVGSM